MDVVQLKPGREKPLQRHHPWVFSGAVDRIKGNPSPGATVIIQDSRAEFLAYGAYSPASQIRLRAWSWDPQEVVDESLLRSRLGDAIQYRSNLPFLRTSKSAENREDQAD